MPEISAQLNVTRDSVGLKEGLPNVFEFSTKEAGFDKSVFNMDSMTGMMQDNFNGDSSRQQLKGSPPILSLSNDSSVEKKGVAGSVLVDFNNKVGHPELAHVESNQLVDGKARPNCPKWKRKARNLSGNSVISSNVHGKRKLDLVGLDGSELEADVSKKFRMNISSNSALVVSVLNKDMNLAIVDSNMFDGDTKSGIFDSGCADFSSTYFSAAAKEQTARSP